MRHISDFYVQNKAVIWFKDKEGGQWGKPASQCKDCMKYYYRGITGEASLGDTPESLEAAGHYAEAMPDEAYPTQGREYVWEHWGPPSPERKSEPESMSDEEVAELVAILNRPRNTM